LPPRCCSMPPGGPVCPGLRCPSEGWLGDLSDFPLRINYLGHASSADDAKIE
jgi:hypothetical protein